MMAEVVHSCDRNQKSIEGLDQSGILAAFDELYESEKLRYILEKLNDIYKRLSAEDVVEKYNL